jgi:hypothetical protein
MEQQEQPFMTNREMISDMHSKMTRMYGTMYGDEAAAVPGIAHRVKSLEEKDKKRTGIYMMIAAISAGLSLGIKAIAEYLKGG